LRQLLHSFSRLMQLKDKRTNGQKMKSLEKLALSTDTLVDLAEANFCVRYLAEWQIKLAHDPVTGDVLHPGSDKHEYGQAAFDSMEEAAAHGCKENCYGSECFVDVQEWAYDQALYEDTGRKVYSWWTHERHLCQDGQEVERVD